MAIRTKTILDLSTTKRSIYRVRRRYMEPGKWIADTDGDDNNPESWARWEVEYFSNYDRARRAGSEDTWVPSTVTPRRGFIDQVKAREVWAALSAEDRVVWLNGRHSVLYPMVSVRV